MEKVQVEGYIYTIPYAGDGYIIVRDKIENFESMRPYERLQAKIEKLKDENTLTIDELLRAFEGKKVKITIEVLE